MPRPALHTLAPDFTAPVIGGSYKTETTLTLSHLRGHKIVLYFYPKDDTPGCTTQACALRDAWSQIQNKAHLFGISTDPIKRHAKFIEKHTLPFPLIADEDHHIVNAYGVWVEKSLYGKKYMGTERTTFILSETGHITTLLEKVKPAEHLQQVLAALTL
ncbi:thioredoxin-dependent thiol peroxidase [Prosthecobacter fluviatilis]|uniref:thioredoxin-dependent peroxiredoxin n=1 Tax=Prosthecobacter fluviatilis TaxID=445931 RepID=A0ABW0KWC9_9BACT